jgi:hypothetical protein
MAEQTEAKAPRGQSTIGFPYKDLESAIATVKVISDSGAVNGVAPDQLAGLLGIAGGTGNFMTRIATARMFGLIGTSTPYLLTELGYEIVDKDERRQRSARSRAFLTVPLYRKLYDTYRGKALPSRPNGLERAMVDFGVAPKQSTNARLAFDRSAKQAGFFNAGEDRLVEPVVTGSVSATLEPATLEARGVVEPRVVEAVGFAGKNAGRHPFIQGLLESLPKPGDDWPVEGRAKWLEAAAHCFDLMYRAKDGAVTIIEVKRPARSDESALSPARPMARGDKGKMDDDAPPAMTSGGRPAARGKAGELDDDIPF